ncbi:hypothetical protein PINS_up005449 [Pythium insidiosum]|nr:hypothetical protein PINS_up005449 [Pythium insidiosum]
MFFNDLFYFDVALRQWRSVSTTGTSPAPRSLATLSASPAQEHLILYGGLDKKKHFASMHVFDIAASRWDCLEQRGDRPFARLNHTLTFVTPRHLVLFGGRKRSARQNDLRLFDLESFTWRHITPWTSSSPSQDAENDPSNDDRERQSAEAPLPRTAHTVIHYERSTKRRSQQILIFGGYAGSHRWLNDLHLVELPADLLSASHSTQPPVAPKAVLDPLETSSSSLSTCMCMDVSIEAILIVVSNRVVCVQTRVKLASHRHQELSHRPSAASVSQLL